MLACAVLGAAGGLAGQIDQSVTLKPGWNAVYVSVAPKASADETFADWPVMSVSAYDARAFLSTTSNAGGFTGEGVVRAPYLIWTREAPAASTLKALAADSVLVCFSTNASAYTAHLRGVPAAPRIAWHETKEGQDVTTTRNAVGVRVSERVKANDWFAGCPVLAKGEYYRLQGPDESTPGYSSLAGFTGNGTAWLNDGDVVFVSGSGVGDWSGPLYVSPRAGVDFATEGMVEEIVVRNDGAAAKTVAVEYLVSSDGATRPDLLCRESYSETATGKWEPFAASLRRELSTGETWRVALALDRTKLAGTGEKLAGVLAIREEGGTHAQAWLPVSAVDAKPVTPWPQGLWLASIRLDKVSYYQADGKRTDGVTSGGTMPVRALVYVDAAGQAKLVQRAVVGSSRVSSAFLPVDLGAVAPSRGAFGDASAPLVFSYTIAADSPSNPFRHALHPLFDGKQMDFKTPAPNGDDIANYQGSVKPEWFSIGGEVEFAFDENAATAWTPVESLAGGAKWTYTGVRRDGPVVAEGRFTMRRIAKEAKVGE